MKKIFFLSFFSVALLSLSVAQTLQYTKWKKFDTTFNDTVVMNFRDGTFILSRQAGSVLVNGLYTENQNTITFEDLYAGNCLSIIGTYTFSINNNILHLNMISDLCTERVTVLNGSYWNRMPGIRIDVPADYTTIQAAIEAANNCDTVLVSENIYYEQINFLGKKPLIVASHYLITGDTNTINNTIIDGSQLTYMDSASLVYFVSGEDTTSVLCGFTIRHGKGTLYTSQGKTIREGGGVFISSSGTKIVHNHITGNNLSNILLGNSHFVRGAGIGCELKTDPHWVVVNDNIIDQNTCSSNNLGASGAGISICYNSRITGNIISDNACIGTGTAFALGAGFECESDTTSFAVIKVILQHNIIKNNHVTTEDSYASSAGGNTYGANSVFSDNEIVNNVVNTGMSNYGGGIISFSNPRVVCIARNNIFSGNTSNLFGTLIIETGEEETVNMAMVENNYFRDNNAKFGGAISVFQTTTLIQNNVFSRNNATQKGGAIYCSPGMVFSTEHLISVVNSSFFGNKSYQGGAIYTLNYTAKPLIINSVFWGDTATQGPEIYMNFINDTIEIANSNIDPALVVGGRFRDGGGNINADPLFTDLINLTPMYTSPVIDAGTASFTCACGETHDCPKFDILGLPRPWGTSLVDIGAYEYTDFTWVHKEIAKNMEIYPNPFTHSVTISYTTEKAGPVLLQVFDNYGRLIAKPINEFQAQGEQKIEWNSGNLPAGIYYCRLQAGERTVSGKIIKIH